MKSLFADILIGTPGECWDVLLIPRAAWPYWMDYVFCFYKISNFSVYR